MYWFEKDGKENDVFVSTRVRLARNIEDYPFDTKLNETGKKEIVEKVKSALSEKKGYKFSDFSLLDVNKKLAMAEKHLISGEFAQNKGICALAENEKDGVYVMVCEEDHIRIQSIRPGFEPEIAAEAAFKADYIIDSEIKIAFDEKLGYLTHCPTNLGTGMRISVMMYLPAMTLTDNMRELQQKLAKLGLTLRGVNGEGSASKGSLYQISNSVTLGESEEEIISNLKEAVAKIAETERKLRDKIKENNEIFIKDKIYRSLGIMKYAYSVDTEEMYRLYSDVRMGICMGIIEGVKLQQLDTLLLSNMPATLKEKSADSDLTAEKRDIIRAESIRNALKQV